MTWRKPAGCPSKMPRFIINSRPMKTAAVFFRVSTMFHAQNRESTHPKVESIRSGTTTSRLLPHRGTTAGMLWKVQFIFHQPFTGPHQAQTTSHSLQSRMIHHLFFFNIPDIYHHFNPHNTCKLIPCILIAYPSV